MDRLAVGNKDWRANVDCRAIFYGFNGSKDRARRVGNNKICDLLIGRKLATSCLHANHWHSNAYAISPEAVSQTIRQPDQTSDRRQSTPSFVRSPGAAFRAGSSRMYP